MELWLTGYDGGQILLPTVTRWEFSYGLGSPCDSFEVTCLWETGAETLLARDTYRAPAGRRVNVPHRDFDHCKKEPGQDMTIRW